MIDQQLRDLGRAYGSPLVLVYVSSPPSSEPPIVLKVRDPQNSQWHIVIGGGETLAAAIADAFKKVAVREQLKLETLEAEINATRARLAALPKDGAQ